MYNNRSLSGSTFFYRILGGVVGGVSGTVVMLMIFFISLATSPADQEIMSGINQFALIAMVLLSTITTNMVSSQIVAMSDREKYVEPQSILVNIFVLNLALFIFTSPLYIFVQGNNVLFIAAFHLLISAQMSALIMEVFAGYQYPLVGAYGVAFGGMTAFAIVSFLLGYGDAINTGMSTIILFIAMPLVWGLIEFFQCLTEIIYQKIYERFTPVTDKKSS